MSNNLLFDWGNRNSEQNAMQRRLEEMGLMEQAIRVRLSQSGQTGGVGGGSIINQSKIQTKETVLLLVKEYGGTYYTYYIADYAKNTMSGPFTTTISFEDYNLDQQLGLQDKGYFFLFRGDADPNDYKMLFLGADGTVLGQVAGYTSDLNINYFNGQWVVASDFDDKQLWYFDGENFIENLTYLQPVDESFTIGSNYDGHTSDGFLLKTVKSNGDNAFCFVTNSNIDEVFSYNTVSTPNINWNAYLYNRSNCLVLRSFDDDTGFYSSLKFLSLPTGVQLEEYSVAAGEYTDLSSYRYGDGNYIWLFYNATEFLVLTYCAATSSIETMTVSRTDYPNWAFESDSFNFYDYNNYPINNTFGILFYNQTGSYPSGLATVSASKLVYSVDGGTLSDYDLKTPGPGTINIRTSLTISKKTILVFTDTFSSEYTAVVVTPSSDYIHPLGVALSEYDNLAIERTGEKIIFYFNLNTSNSKFFTISANGNTCTLSDLPGELIDYLELDYDSVIVFGDTSGKQWRLDGSTDTLVEMPKYNETWSTENYTNPQLKRDGRLVQVKYNRINYTHTQMTDPPVAGYSEAAPEDFAMDGTVVAGTALDFGVGSSYFTNLYPGMFVLCAKDINISSFSIDGNIGADGSGSVDLYDFTVEAAEGAVYTVFVKRVYSAGDPSINHIIIVNGENLGISHTADLESDDDAHTISEIPNSVTELHYLLLAQPSGNKIDDTGIINIVSEYMPMIFDKTATVALSNLNSGYGDITSIFTPFLFNDVPENNQPNSIGDGGDDMYDGANFITTNRSTSAMRIVTSGGALTTTNLPSNFNILENGKNMIGVLYSDLANSGKMSLKIYSTTGVLKQYIKTPHFDYQDFDIVGDRAILVALDKEFDGMTLYYNTTAYAVGLTSYTSKNYLSLDSNGFRVRAMNDTTWYD